MTGLKKASKKRMPHHRVRRYGPEGDSHAGPHPDPRAPLGVPPALALSEENGFPHVCLKCEE